MKDEKFEEDHIGNQ